MYFLWDQLTASILFYYAAWVDFSFLVAGVLYGIRNCKRSNWNQDQIGMVQWRLPESERTYFSISLGTLESMNEGYLRASRTLSTLNLPIWFSWENLVYGQRQKTIDLRICSIMQLNSFLTLPKWWMNLICGFGPLLRLVFDSILRGQRGRISFYHLLRKWTSLGLSVEKQIEYWHSR